MTTARTLLTTLIAALLLSVSFGTTAYASEAGTQTAPSKQSTTEGFNDTLVSTVSGTAIAADSDSGAAITANDTSGSAITTELQTEAASEAKITVGDGLTDEQIAELLLQDGYYLDEQGQLCYETPEKDEASQDNTEEDTEVQEEEKANYSEKDLRLLACLIYSEAGNQNYDGMLAVANVVLNRAKSDAYWHVDTVEKVIYDRKWSVQFAVTIKNSRTGMSMMDKALKLYDTRKFTGSNPESQKKALNRAIKAAKAALMGKNNIGNYLCFQVKYSARSIKKRYPDYKIIDDHIFYRTK